MAVELPPKLWLPPKPAIVRAASLKDVEQWQPPVKGMFPFPLAAFQGRLEISNTDNESSGTDGSSFSFTSQSYGAVPPAGYQRYIAVAVGAAAGTDSVTIAGVAVSGSTASTGANHLVGSGGAGVQTRVSYLLLNTGTSGTVGVTFSGSVGGCAISVFRIISNGQILVHGTDTKGGGGVDPLNFSIPVARHGVVILATGQNNGGSVSWTNATPSTNVDVQTNEFISHAFYQGGAAIEASRSITANSADDTPAAFGGCAASFRAYPA